VALLSTAATLFVSVLAAYAIAGLGLRLRGLVLSTIIAVPTFPLLVPLFETMRTLNLLDTHTALVLPDIVSSLPVCTLILVSFFEAMATTSPPSPRTWR
jgi:multiple sugar transport system permease protein